MCSTRNGCPMLFTHGRLYSANGRTSMSHSRCCLLCCKWYLTFAACFWIYILLTRVLPFYFGYEHTHPDAPTVELWGVFLLSFVYEIRLFSYANDAKLQRYCGEAYRNDPKRYQQWMETLIQSAHARRIRRLWAVYDICVHRSRIIDTWRRLNRASVVGRYVRPVWKLHSAMDILNRTMRGEDYISNVRSKALVLHWLCRKWAQSRFGAHSKFIGRDFPAYGFTMGSLHRIHNAEKLLRAVSDVFTCEWNTFHQCNVGNSSTSAWWLSRGGCLAWWC